MRYLIRYFFFESHHTKREIRLIDVTRSVIAENRQFWSRGVNFDAPKLSNAYLTCKQCLSLIIVIQVNFANMRQECLRKLFRRLLKRNF